MANDLPPWESHWGYFRPWKKSGLWPRIDEKLGQEDWRSGRKA